MSSFDDYIQHAFGSNNFESEIVHIIDAITTNTTTFFRESQHFSFLGEEFKTAVCNANKKTKVWRIWSAGCSTGEEPYSLAISLEQSFSDQRWFQYSIVATDISVGVLQKAAAGIYPEERVEDVPKHVLVRYFMRSKDKSKALVRVVPEIRERIEFRVLNFMSGRWDCIDEQDVIFCRNVLIYFTKKTQQEVLSKMCGKLSPGGFLFIGHSESLSCMRLPLVQVRPTIYRKVDASW